MLLYVLMNIFSIILIVIVLLNVLNMIFLSCECWREGLCIILAFGFYNLISVNLCAQFTFFILGYLEINVSII